VCTSPAEGDRLEIEGEDIGGKGDYSGEKKSIGKFIPIHGCEFDS